MIYKKLIKFKILVKQNILAFSIILLWFFANLISFTILAGDLTEAFLILFYFQTHSSLYGNFYANFSEFIIFGVVFSLITIELFRKYNPVTTSREISKKFMDHAVIIGYSHIGKRISDYFTKMDIPHVIIEEDYKKVESLINQEKAVINDNPLDKKTLKDAGVPNARAVYIMDDNLELQMVVNAEIRDLNKGCRLIDRIFEDEIAEVIASTYNAHTISTSRFAADVLFEKVRKRHYENVLLIGLNHISSRLINHFEKKPYIEFKIIEEDQEKIEDLMVSNEKQLMMGDPKDVKILQSLNIENFDCIINTISKVTESIVITKRIRDLNRSCKIFARFFQDSIAKVLEKSPFNAEVISSSYDTLNNMIDKGLLII